MKEPKTIKAYIKMMRDIEKMTIESEVDYRNSDEAISEDIQANDYQFLESGEQF